MRPVRQWCGGLLEYGADQWVNMYLTFPALKGRPVFDTVELCPDGSAARTGL